MRVVLGAAIVLAIFLRAHDIATNPPELFEDEISGATSAWSVVTTGHDVIADHLPLFTTRLGPQLPLYGLATVPFQAVLGHTVLAVRLPAVLFGVADVILLYALVAAVGGRRLGLIAAVIAAVLPWAVHFSRIGWDNAAYPPVLLAGLLLLLGALRRADPRWAIGAAVVLALSVYTYQIAILMTPLFALALAWPFRSRARHFPVRDGVIAIVTGLAIVAPYVWRTLAVPEFTARARSISTFADGVTGASLATFVHNYLANLSPVYLFVSGDDNLRHGTGRGELLLWMLPFAILGGAWCLLHAKREALAFAAIAWLVLAPLPAAITDDGVPHAARSMLELLAWPMVISVGATIAWRAIAARQRAPIAAAFAILAVLETTSYYRDLYTTYPTRSSAYWQFGTAATMADVRRITPAGGTACIDTLSAFTFPHLERWYLSGVSFAVVERDAAACASPGDVLAIRADEPPPANSREIDRVDDLAGTPVARIWQRR